MALKDDVANVLREDESNTEILDLIDAAKADLKLSGVVERKIIESDMLIKRAINLYCKAHYAYDDPKISERFENAYICLKNHLCLSTEYTEAHL